MACRLQWCADSAYVGQDRQISLRIHLLSCARARKRWISSPICVLLLHGQINHAGSGLEALRTAIDAGNHVRVRNVASLASDHPGTPTCMLPPAMNERLDWGIQSSFEPVLVSVTDSLVSPWLREGISPL